MMLSRVADAFFWMGRYLERAEHSARVLEVYMNLALDNLTEEVIQAVLQRLIGRDLSGWLGEFP